MSIFNLKLACVFFLLIFLTACFRPQSVLVGTWAEKESKDSITFWKSGLAVNTENDTAQWKISAAEPYILTLIEEGRESSDSLELEFVGKDTLRFFFFGDTIEMYRQIH